MISFGPEIQGAHSPDERLHLESTQNFWALFVATLDARRELLGLEEPKLSQQTSL